MVINHARIGDAEKTIVIEHGKITAVTDEVIAGGIDAAGKRVIPGLIDVHTHGMMGMDTLDANFEPLCRFYASKGTTSFLPTTMTVAYDRLEKVCAAKTDFPGAQILGFHFEGPFIAEEHKGAQNPAYIKDPDPDVMQRFKNIKMITLAPERPGAEEFIRTVSKDMIVSIGHSVCDYDTALKAIDWGVNCLTHTYNAMPPFHHRAPGPIGAAYERKIYAQVICDGFHVLPPVMLATYQMFGPERMVIISDSVGSAGLPDGIYRDVSGLEVVVRAGDVVRLADGSSVAGSSSTLWDCVRTAIRCGIPFEDAVRMATTTPAEMLGVNKGVIAPGYDADLLIIDDDMEIDTVIIAGQVWEAPSL